MSNPDLDKLLADEAAKVAAMTTEERREYLDQIVAVQRANVKPYIEGERQARAMRPKPTLADAVALIDAEATKIAVLAAGLEPRRQAALESGEEPTTFGEEMWAAGMRLRRLSAALQTKEGAITPQPAPTLADAVELPEIKALVGTATKTLAMVEDLVAESGRAIKYDAEDAFRMGEWFDDADMQDITKAHAALAALQTKGGA
jgi:hypothetical protein